ncbi:hypothetical protein EDC04DRAFT_2896043 [Pisolithus marmoratus]|nr:hypothetical protein EDC04DRAFT_2896043 [Pisolithus marmoratus]
MAASDGSAVPDLDVKQAIGNAMFEVLCITPTKLLHIGTVILCNWHAQASDFMGIQQCERLPGVCAKQAAEISKLNSWPAGSVSRSQYDISKHSQNSEWFRRGWTLLKLLVLRTILFYTPTSDFHKAEVTVWVTHIIFEAAMGFIASYHLTRRYRLFTFGIFDIHLPIHYGESAENALGRLLAEIISKSRDLSVLD